MNIKLATFSDINIGYSLRDTAFEVNGENIKIIQPKDVDNFGKVNFTNLKTTNVPRLKDQVLQPEDILLISRGRFFAFVFENNANDKIIASSLFLRIRIKKNSNIIPEYIALYLNSPIGQADMSKRFAYGGTMPIITKAELADLTIPIPDIASQRKLVALGQEFDNFSKLHGIQIKLYETIFNNAINKITGENNG